MDRHVVIGTAGHVDHGKTALVRSLTGTDTDRWAEEKRRGITIDLGFALLDLGDGLSASIVDVPGHEDFVRNMVAGATGVDVALLVVAADEGVMPQTLEHLAILEFLAVQTGVVFVTKCDLVERDWLALVEDDVTQHLSHSSIQWTDVVHGSATTGEGLDELRGALARASERAAVRSQHDLFRLPVDRVFSVAGAGTVVTGTTWSGTIAVGNEVRLLPGERRARVRGVEVHGRSCQAALPGRRTALALAGLERKSIARGHVVVGDDSWRETTVVDVMVTLLPDARPLTQRSRVRFHLGTAEVMARVTPTEGVVEPGSCGAARLRLESPIVCRWGDRGVVRSYSPVRTIGGCVVVDPWPPLRPRRPIGLLSRAAKLPAERTIAFVEAAGSRGIRTRELPVRLGVSPRDVDAVVESGPGIVRIKQRLVAPRVATAARNATLEALRGYHDSHPLQPGMPRELARRVIRDSDLAEYLQLALHEEGLIVVEGETVRLVDHRSELSGGQVDAGRRIRQELAAAGIHGRTLAQLEDVLPGGEVLQLAGFLVRQGTVVRVGKDRYYDSNVLDALQRDILCEVDRLDRATPADLRETTGLSRKYLIPLLEWMDGRSLTVRDGDARALGPAARDLLGDG